ncbi:MAG: outer membrane beta-barrel family protein, partial [Muribaculaceae bacterium]
NAPFGLVLSSDINFKATSGYSDGFDTRTWMWNASVGYQFLKGKAATVSLKAYDILGQRSNVRRSVTANYIDDQRYNSLQRYIMVTVAYRFNTFGRGQQPEVGGFDGPGGPGGPPRGRMHRGGPPM